MESNRSVEVKELVVFRLEEGASKVSRSQAQRLKRDLNHSQARVSASHSACLKRLPVSSSVRSRKIISNGLTEKAVFAQCLGASAGSEDEARCCDRCFRSEWLHLSVLKDSVVVLSHVKDVTLCSEKETNVAFLVYHISE